MLLNAAGDRSHGRKEAEPDKTVSPKHETCTGLCPKPVGKDACFL